MTEDEEQRERILLAALERLLYLNEEPVDGLYKWLRDYLQNLGDEKDWGDPKIRHLRITLNRENRKKLTSSELQTLSEEITSGHAPTWDFAKRMALDEIDQATELSNGAKELLSRFLDYSTMPAKKGRKALTNQSRNWMLKQSVERLVRQGFPESGGEDSACDIVAEQMCRLGHPMSGDAVRKAIKTLTATKEGDEMSAVEAERLQRYTDEYIKSGR